MKLINDLNWTFCYFNHEEFRAQIHQGGYLEGETIMELYYVNVFKNHPENELIEVDQVEFGNLSEALKYINKNFNHWKFVNQLDNKFIDAKGGCGSCIAH